MVATVCVQVCVGVLGMLHDSRAIRVKVVFRAVVEVRLDSADTAAELPSLIHLRYLCFATCALDNLLAPSRYRYLHM